MKPTGSLYWLGEILRRRVGNPTRKLLLLAMADHVDGDDKVRARISLLAAEAEVSVATARRHLTDMETAGLISRSRTRHDDGTQGVYETTLLRDGIAGLRPALNLTSGSSAQSSAHLDERAEPPNIEPPNKVCKGAHEPREQLFDHQWAVSEYNRSVVDLFDEFWSVYPRKSSKGVARNSWARAIKKAEPVAIISAAARYAADPNRVDAYTKHASTWLNGECWNDPPLPARSRAGQPPTRAYGPNWKGSADDADDWNRLASQS